jgi:hypothetical protein
MRGERSRPPRNRGKKSYPKKGQDYKKKNYSGNKGRKKR